MAEVKYIQCDLCKKRIAGWSKKFRGIYSSAEHVEHICWECWVKFMEFVAQKKKEEREGKE